MFLKFCKPLAPISQASEPKVGAAGYLLLVAALAMMPCSVALSAAAGQAQADRITQIQSCSHGPNESCPYSRMLFVDQHHPRASDDNPGTRDKPLRTINLAAQMALPDDAVLVSAGVYREHVAPAHSGYDLAHMITYRAEEDEKVVITGSDVWEPE